jgi:hypothetical protein
LHSFTSATRFSAGLLTLSDAAAIADARFLARNFRLETAVAPARAGSYLPGGDFDIPGEDPNAKINSWNGHHGSYLSQNVRAGARADGFDLDDPSASESFRVRSDIDEFGHVDDKIELVRVENLDDIASRTATDPGTLDALAHEAARQRRELGSVETVVREQLEDVLYLWQELGGLDNRPVFASFWENARELLDDPAADWANSVRDKLGLAHLDPDARLRGDGIRIMAFRYPAALIPRGSRREPRLVARPTVLDGSLSTAFCTTAAGIGRGCCVDLGADGDIPWQEIIHPPIRFKAEWVWAVGRVSSPVPPSLRTARELHLAAICETADTSFKELVDETDGDLR